MRMLVPVDGSPDSMAAVTHAAALVAAGLDADAVLVNVQEPPTLYEVVTAHDAELLDQVRMEAGADLLAPAEALLEAAGVAWQSEVVGGQPGTMIAELAENYRCDAVVMGARGVGRPEGAGVGSAAQGALNHCTVPVTIVRLAAADAREGSRGEDGEPPAA